MAKVWSFNTTVRNPERMENMLRALIDLEGQKFDLKGQEAFFGLQIKKRLYKPTKSTLEEKDLIDIVYSDTSADDIDDLTVKRILEKYRGRSVNGSGRGRTAAGILNRFGLCIALQSHGPVVITELAKKWLNDEIDDDELFTKFFLKWQYPNHIEDGYSTFDIKPFIGVISLINSVNDKWKALGNKPIGLSKEEYRLFIPSLTKVSQIKEYSEKIINFRSKKESIIDKEKTEFVKNFTKGRVADIFGTDSDLEKDFRDLHDYTDSSIRYFRMSGLIALRGHDTHIDIAEDKEIEIKSLLNKISPHADQFDSYESYFDFLSNINSLNLPWQNEDDLQKIILKLSSVLKTEAGEVGTTKYLSEIENLPVNKKVVMLETALNQTRIEKLRELRHDIPTLNDCILKLKSITGRNYEPLTSRPSLDLEWYVSRSLMVLNDAVEIIPSYNIGDDGIPTGFRSNLSDIECYYENFGMTVEVTLLIGRDQWVAEGQPVMRHFRDFEDKLKKENAYCLFIAPILHRDAINTFWGSNKSEFGYEGKNQKIIPLTLNQYLDVLKIAKEKINKKTLNHKTLNELFNLICGGIKDVKTPQDWLSLFPNYIKKWSETN